MGFIRLRRENATDLKKLACQVGWNFTDDQIALFMTAGTVSGVFSETADERALIGASAVYPYGRDLASLGIVMVRPDQQHQGIGTAIVSHCLSLVCAETVVTLVATAAGRPVYESVGFHVVEHVHRYELSSTVHTITRRPGSSLSAVQREELPRFIALDERVCGGNRRAAYQGLFHMSPLGVVARDKQGDIQGFAMAVRGTDRFLVGPVIADGVAMALDLVHALVEKLRHSDVDTVAALKQPVIRLDVPSRQAEFAGGLLELGFTETRMSPVMNLGGRTFPGHRERLFAIFDPALG